MSQVTILQQIARERQADVDAARASRSLDTVRAEALRTPAPGGRFAAALRTTSLEVIAEVKRASPSRGRIAGIPDPVALASAYAAGGAAAISVLTEPRHFLGSDEDLRQVAAATGLPCLRKDFIVDPYQVWEARLLGASACLLIVALLPTVDQLRPLLDVAGEAGLDVLVETHDEQELRTAIDAGATIIGVNHRNLHTFEMDMTLFERLRPQLPAGAIAVAESGVHEPATAARLRRAGADAILVGEHLARAADPAAALRQLREAASCS